MSIQGVGIQGSGVQGGEELPPGDAAVADGETIVVRNFTGIDPHNGTAVVAGEPPVIEGINLPSGTAMVDNSEPVEITQTAGGGTPFATASARVANGLLASVSVPASVAVVSEGDTSINLEQFDGSGFVAAIPHVSANVLSAQLANATTRIAIDTVGVTISCSNGKTAGATIAVDQGAFGHFPLSSPLDTILSDNDLVQVENQGATQGVNGVVSVAAQSPIIKLPPSTAMVANGVGISGAPVTGTYVDTITPQVDADGNITGFTLS